MVGIALIRKEFNSECEINDKECIGVFKTYESALIAMAEDRRKLKEVHYFHYEDEKSLSVALEGASGMGSMDIIYEMIPVQKIEA